jgi:hypothetical protein
MEPWQITMLLVCAASCLLGYMAAWISDEWSK